MDNTAVERSEDALLGSMAAKSNGAKSGDFLDHGATLDKLGSSAETAAAFIENESHYSGFQEGGARDLAVPISPPRGVDGDHADIPEDTFEDAERDLLISHGTSAASARDKEGGKQAGVNKTGVTVGEGEGAPEGDSKTEESDKDFVPSDVPTEESTEGEGELGGASDVVNETVGGQEEGGVTGASSEELKEELNVSDGTAKDSGGDQATSEKEQAAIGDDDDEWEDILGSGQIKKKVVKKAENSHRPGQNSICEINLIGRLEDGSEVERYENLKLDLGDVEVIQGIDLALPLMEIGEVALVEIGPRFAYGALGKAPNIPPNARMFYSVELLSAEDTPELETLPISKRKAIGNRKRERGNWWFARQEYNFAIHCYRRAIEYLDDVTEGFSSENREEGQNIDDELQDLLENRLKVYNNLAAAQMKIKVYDAALTSVENVLRCQPQNVKALFRKGKILAAKGDTANAVSVLSTAKKLEPDNSVIKQELLRCMSLLKQDTNQEKNLYKKMLGQDKQQPENVARGQSKSRGVTWGLVCGSIVAVLVGALAFRYKFP